MDRMSILIWATALNLQCTALVHGHVGDRVFPFFEITDDVLSEIDFQDGSIEEYELLMG